MRENFLVDRNSLIKPKVKFENIQIKTILEEQEAEDLIEIQSIAIQEIKDEVNELKKESLTKRNEYAFDDLRFCIAKNDEGKCIGYGFGYNHPDNKEIFYIETIAVSRDFRGKGIASNIKFQLSNSAFENEKILAVQAITQPDNEATIKINENLGFIKV